MLTKNTISREVFIQKQKGNKTFRTTKAEENNQ